MTSQETKPLCFSVSYCLFCCLRMIPKNVEKNNQMHTEKKPVFPSKLVNIYILKSRIVHTMSQHFRAKHPLHETASTVIKASQISFHKRQITSLVHGQHPTGTALPFQGMAFKVQLNVVPLFL